MCPFKREVHKARPIWIRLVSHKEHRHHSAETLKRSCEVSTVNWNQKVMDRDRINWSKWSFLIFFLGFLISLVLIWVFFLLILQASHSAITFAGGCLPSYHVSHQERFAARSIGCYLGYRGRFRLWWSITWIFLFAIARAIQPILRFIRIFGKWHVHRSSVTDVILRRQLPWLVSYLCTNRSSI